MVVSRQFAGKWPLRCPGGDDISVYPVVYIDLRQAALSCGTGVTAAALASSFHGYTSPIHIKVKGGELSVEFKTTHSGPSGSHAVTFHNVFLIGPAKMVFEGDLEL